MINQALRRKADRLWMKIAAEINPRCWICGRPIEDIHHFWRKGQYGWLRYDLDNACSCCRLHHGFIDSHDRETIQILVSRRGAEWYNRLKEKAENKPPRFIYDDAFANRCLVALEQRARELHVY